MANASSSSEKKSHAAIKALIFVLFIIGAYVLIRHTPLKVYLTAKALGAFLQSAGLWAPVVFIAFYAVGVCLLIPGTLLTGLGAALFGAYWGFLYVWIGAMVGASGAFWIGRTLGRDFAANRIGDRLKKYDEAIARNGFAVVLYLRLIYFPFTAMNFGMGLTQVRFQDFFIGTGLGILVGTFIFTFFIGALKDIWASGQWSQLLSAKILLSVALFVFSFFIPPLIKRIKKEI